MKRKESLKNLLDDIETNGVTHGSFLQEWAGRTYSKGEQVDEVFETPRTTRRYSD